MDLPKVKKRFSLQCKLLYIVVIKIMRWKSPYIFSKCQNIFYESLICHVTCMKINKYFSYIAFK